MAAATLYVRKTGSDNNGGSSVGTSPDRTGTDGVTAGTTTFVAATGGFSAGDVDKVINIVTKGRYRITAFTNSTTVTLSSSPSAGAALTWNLGGAVASIGALLANANAAVANGDAIWVGAGQYREVVTLANTNTAEVTVNADVDGKMTGDVGEVQWTAYTTNDTTAPSGSSCMNCAGKDFLTFNRFVFISGTNGTAPHVDSTTTSSTNMTFNDCTFVPSNGGNSTSCQITVAAGINAAWLFDRCTFMGVPRNVAAGLIQVNLNRHSADYDANVIIRNCVLIGGPTALIRVSSTGAGAGFGGGVIANACTLFGSTGMTTSDANLATSIPCQANNCLIIAGTGLNANTSGQITESYNLIAANTARTNVTAGTGSISDGSRALLINLGQSLDLGRLARPFLSPMPNAPFLGFGAGTSPPAVDRLNRVRPSGGASTSITAGAFEVHDFAAKETTVTDAGGVAIKLTGPGDQDFRVPVDATSTTITVRVRYDTNHGTGSKPQAMILADGEIGVTAQTVTAAAAVDTWETLTFSAFTPTAKGWVILRLVSRAAAGNGIAYFDTVTVA